MDTPDSTLRFERKFKAPAKEVFRAFTSQVGLEEWLCDVANAHAVAGGRLYLWWNKGFYSAGEFIEVNPVSKVVFSWRGKSDPASSRVCVMLKEVDGAVALTLEHSGIQKNGAWEKAYTEISAGWETAFEHLASILDSGNDLRVINRPMLGILLGDFSADRAAELKVPVSIGVRLEGVMDDMGAQKAGLQKNDVIVQINQQAITGFESIATAIQGKKTGDKIHITYYRESQQNSIWMELSRRKIPEMPETPSGLAELIENSYKACMPELERTILGLSESEASFKPAPGEWNIKETLAHLIHNERDFHVRLHKAVNDEKFYFPENDQFRLDVITATYPDAEKLLTELKNAQAETITAIKCLPENYIAHKGAFWSLCFEQTSYPDHLLEHLGQIKGNLEAFTKK